MLSKTVVVPAVCFFVLGACATAEATSKSSKSATIAQAALADASGTAVGTARIEQNGSGLALVAEVRGLTPGEHGIHLHTTGKCDAPSFTSAGAHLNPTSHQHGSLNPAGPHLGDLPNITVAADGTGSVSAPMTGEASTLLANLFDADGTAVVVHAGPDDYKTDPSGNSGGRIACGALARTQK